MPLKWHVWVNTLETLEKSASADYAAAGAGENFRPIAQSLDRASLRKADACGDYLDDPAVVGARLRVWVAAFTSKRLAAWRVKAP
jgi:hypothetical protein